MPVRNGHLGTDRTTTTQATSVRKQLGTKNSRDGSAEELDRETGEEPIIVGWTPRKDGG